MPDQVDPLIIQFTKSKNYELLEKWLKMDCSQVDETCTSGFNSLYIASELGLFEMVKLLVDYGANVNHTSPIGFSPLCMAVRNNHINIVKYLLTSGANVDNKNLGDMTPLMWAACFKRKEIYSLLLRYGADVGLQDKQGRKASDMLGFYTIPY